MAEFQEIDYENWPRREIFELFSHTAQPFFGVSFRADVTPLYEYAKREKLSSYYCLCRCVTLALNRVENFRYALRDGKVGLLRERLPSFTVLRPGEECFHIITMPSLYGSAREFCEAAAEKDRTQNTLLAQGTETDDLVYLSCAPWLELTAVHSEGLADPDDNIPRVTWGKWTVENGRRLLTLTLEANHRFADGLHAGRFAEALQQEIAALSLS